MMIICMDTNFRLKNNLVSNYSQDLGLGTGWAYMLQRQPYETYVLSRTNNDFFFFFFKSKIYSVVLGRSLHARYPKIQSATPYV